MNNRDLPHKKHQHVFGIVRVDLPAELGDGSWVRHAVSGTKAFLTKEEAEAEAQRLESLNAGKRCRYVVVYLRLVDS